VSLITPAFVPPSRAVPGHGTKLSTERSCFFERFLCLDLREFSAVFCCSMTLSRNLRRTGHRADLVLALPVAKLHRRVAGSKRRVLNELWIGGNAADHNIERRDHDGEQNGDQGQQRRARERCKISRRRNTLSLVNCAAIFSSMFANWPT